MGVFGDFAKAAFGDQIKRLEKAAKDTARSMSNDQILKKLDDPDVKAIARKALREEAERRGLV